MISRRKILSKSCDKLPSYGSMLDLNDEDEDVWFSRDKLFKDHIQEVLNKWEQIEDEIWAKIICMEKNRRIAKAYARAPVITVTGSNDGFDGYRIGLGGFDNPLRDAKTEDVKKMIGDGLKIKMDEEGNILVKRLSKSNVFVKEWSSNHLDTQSSCVADSIIKTNGKLEYKLASKLFDMSKFQTNVSNELRCAYPDRKKLEFQCISVFAMVKDASDILNLPSWIMVINVVALEMLKSKMPPILNSKTNLASKTLLSIFEHSILPVKENMDTSDIMNQNHTTKGQRFNTLNSYKKRQRKEPQFQRSDKHQTIRTKKQIEAVEVPAPDYDSTSISSANSVKFKRNDDPYYSGFMARVPDFGYRTFRNMKSQGYLNSVLRHLPIQTSLASSQQQLSSSGSSVALGTDSEEIYGHIYSSISDSKDNQNGIKKQSKPKRSLSIKKIKEKSLKPITSLKSWKF